MGVFAYQNKSATVPKILRDFYYGPVPYPVLSNRNLTTIFRVFHLINFRSRWSYHNHQLSEYYVLLDFPNISQQQTWNFWQSNRYSQRWIDLGLNSGLLGTQETHNVEMKSPPDQNLCRTKLVVFGVPTSTLQQFRKYPGVSRTILNRSFLKENISIPLNFRLSSQRSLV